MEKEDQLYNWLTTAFTETNLIESFYFDRKGNEFFSILLLDYFLVDENLNLNKDAQANYTPDILPVLIDRIKRIDRKCDSILDVPKAGNRTNIQSQIDTFLNLNAIDISSASIWEPGNPSFIFKVRNEDEELRTKKPWWKFW